MSDNLATFRGKDIVVTGHTGFKGAWLSLWLAELGAKVHGYALAPEEPSLFVEARVADRLASHVIGDIRDRSALTAFVQRVRPQIVLHLAAQPLVRKSYREPVETWDTNVMGAIHLMEFGSSRSQNADSGPAEAHTHDDASEISDELCIRGFK